jgi:hypothetical protein
MTKLPAIRWIEYGRTQSEIMDVHLFIVALAVIDQAQQGQAPNQKEIRVWLNVLSNISETSPSRRVFGTKCWLIGLMKLSD